LTHKTALLFFSRTASHEAASKSFVEGKNKKVNQRLSSLLIQSARKTAVRSGLPFFEINSTEQEGNSFGERISNALASVFSSGFDSVIVIGNDCPQLTVSHIKTSTEGLADNKLVLGPDNRGGVYLVGINKAIFNQRGFIDLPWQSPELYNNLRSFMPVEASLLILPALKDINNFSDLIKVSTVLNFSHVVSRFIVSFLSSFFTTIQASLAGYCSQVSFLSGLRAPPLT